jgi:hypothetical protein
MTPITTMIEAAGITAHQGLRSDSTQAAGRARGSATSAACSRLSVAIETGKDGIAARP